MAGERHLRMALVGEHESTSSPAPVQACIEQPQLALPCERQQCPPAGFAHSAISVPLKPCSTVVHSQKGPDDDVV